MKSSIQDYLKKINSSITWLACFGLFVTALFLGVFTGFLYFQQKKVNKEVVYLQKEYEESFVKAVDTRPFGSKNGKTYTFSWCSRSNVILEKNKVYYANEEDAKSSGRLLSKLCQK